MKTSMIPMAALLVAVVVTLLVLGRKKRFVE